jgi:hypothetical protein
MRKANGDSNLAAVSGFSVFACEMSQGMHKPQAYRSVSETSHSCFHLLAAACHLICDHHG